MIPKHTVKTFTLPNGIRLINVSASSFPIATSSVWINAGSRMDPPNKQGLSHFFEHLLYTRTLNYPNRQSRLEEVEKNGFLYNAFTTVQSQHYFYAHTPSKSEKALSLLLDGLEHSLIEKNDIDREKDIIVAEERDNFNDPSSYIWRLANKGLWENSQIGKDFYGDKKSISSITHTDIDSFINNNFAPENILFIFINSNTEESKQIDEISKFIPTVSGSMHDAPHETFQVKPVAYERREIDTVQLAFSFVCPPALGRNRVLQDFISHYFASGWTSRLIQKLRVENNLTYWVYPTNVYLPETGYLRFTLSTKPEFAEQVYELFQKEVEAIKRSHIPLSAMQSHKVQMLAELERNSIDYNWLMQWYGYVSLIFNQTKTIEEYASDIDSVNEKQVLSYTQEHMTQDHFSLAYIASKKIPFAFTHQ